MCRFPGCKSTFAKDGQSRRNHELKHNPPVVIPGEEVRSESYFEDLPNEADDMLNYQKALLEYGMLIANLRDAISEGTFTLILTYLYSQKFFVVFFLV